MLQIATSAPPLARKYHETRKAIRKNFEEAAFKAQVLNRVQTIQHKPTRVSATAFGPGFNLPSVPVDFNKESVPCSLAQPPAPSISRVPVIKLSAIKQAVAVFYGVTVEDLISGRRTQNIMKPRHVAFFLAKTLSNRSLPEIGRQMGGRDHTTVLHGFRNIKKRMQTGKQLEADIQHLTAILTFKLGV